LEQYVLPGSIGYEYRFEMGLHLQLDAGFFFELLRAETAGIMLPKFRFQIAYEF
jgi:hypothetical protein